MLPKLQQTAASIIDDDVRGRAQSIGGGGLECARVDGGAAGESVGIAQHLRAGSVLHEVSCAADTACESGVPGGCAYCERLGPQSHIRSASAHEGGNGLVGTERKSRAAAAGSVHGHSGARARREGSSDAGVEGGAIDNVSGAIVSVRISESGCAPIDNKVRIRIGATNDAANCDAITAACKFQRAAVFGERTGERQQAATSVLDCACAAGYRHVTGQAACYAGVDERCGIGEVDTRGGTESSSRTDRDATGADGCGASISIAARESQCSSAAV